MHTINSMFPTYSRVFAVSQHLRSQFQDGVGTLTNVMYHELPALIRVHGYPTQIELEGFSNTPSKELVTELYEGYVENGRRQYTYYDKHFIVQAHLQDFCNYNKIRRVLKHVAGCPRRLQGFDENVALEQVNRTYYLEPAFRREMAEHMVNEMGFEHFINCIEGDDGLTRYNRQRMTPFKITLFFSADPIFDTNPFKNVDITDFVGYTCIPLEEIAERELDHAHEVNEMNDRIISFNPIEVRIN